MVKQWVQPPISKYHIYIYILPPGGFLLGSHLTSVNLSISTIKLFIGILGESFEIQCLLIFYIDLIRELIKFEIEFFNFHWYGFYWNIRGTLIQNTP